MLYNVLLLNLSRKCPLSCSHSQHLIYSTRLWYFNDLLSGNLHIYEPIGPFTPVTRFCYLYCSLLDLFYYILEVSRDRFCDLIGVIVFFSFSRKKNKSIANQSSFAEIVRKTVMILAVYRMQS